MHAGDFVDNKMVGKARIDFPNGDEYEGDYKDGKREGYGIMRFADSGNVYEGQWEDDEITGRGKLTYPTGEVHKGTFSKGVHLGMMKPDVDQHVEEQLLGGGGSLFGRSHVERLGSVGSDDTDDDDSRNPGSRKQSGTAYQ